MSQSFYFYKYLLMELKYIVIIAYEYMSFHFVWLVSVLHVILYKEVNYSIIKSRWNNIMFISRFKVDLYFLVLVMLWTILCSCNKLDSPFHICIMISCSLYLLTITLLYMQLYTCTFWAYNLKHQRKYAYIYNTVLYS